MPGAKPSDSMGNLGPVDGRGYLLLPGCNPGVLGLLSIRNATSLIPGLQIVHSHSPLLYIGGVGLQEAQENRSYVVNKMMLEIGEIERVLQLTTYDEDEWDSDDITIMKRATVSNTG